MLLKFDQKNWKSLFVLVQKAPRKERHQALDVGRRFFNVGENRGISLIFISLFTLCNQFVLQPYPLFTDSDSPDFPRNVVAGSWELRGVRANFQ
jgi:hypothetical protein